MFCFFGSDKMRSEKSALEGLDPDPNEKNICVRYLKHVAFLFQGWWSGTERRWRSSTPSSRSRWWLRQRPWPGESTFPPTSSSSRGRSTSTASSSATSTCPSQTWWVETPFSLFYKNIHQKRDLLVKNELLAFQPRLRIESGSFLFCRMLFPFKAK